MTPHETQLLSDLNTPQRDAVTSDALVLRCIAGAGSGKTRVLTRRIAFRVAAEDLDPRRILAVTFTRKAAGELRERTQQLGLRSPVSAGTFHSIAFLQLRQRWQERAITPPAMLDRKVGFVARLMRSKSSTLPLDVVNEIEWAKARMISAHDYPMAAAGAQRQISLEYHTVAEIFERYELDKRRQRLIDFDDILRFATRDLETNDQFRAARQWRFRHLFVDEFQDVNPLQFRLLKAWVGDDPDLCVVGDPNQAIYSWNGADSHYLREFTSHYRDAATIELTDNYRSTPQILGVANTLLASVGGAGFSLNAHRGDGPIPQIHVCSDDTDEATSVARRIRDHHKPSSLWSDQVVLTRTHAQLVAIQEALVGAGIPFVMRGAASILKQPEVIDALKRMSRTPGGFHVALSDLQSDLEASEASERSPFSELTDDRLANIYEVARLANEYAALTPDPTPDDFSAWIAATVDAGTTWRSDAVTLDTFHGSKGLEWPIVHIAGAEEGYLPIHYAKTDAAVDEELRLLYVALTRAREALHLSYCTSRTFGAKQARRKPSRYLEPIALAIELLSHPERTLDPTEALHKSRARLSRPSSSTANRGKPAPSALLSDLKSWRLDRARAADVPAFVIFSDATLAEVAQRKPLSIDELLDITGIGPVKAQRFGDELLKIVKNDPGGLEAVP